MINIKEVISIVKDSNDIFDILNNDVTIQTAIYNTNVNIIQLNLEIKKLIASERSKNFYKLLEVLGLRKPKAIITSFSSKKDTLSQLEDAKHKLKTLKANLVKFNSHLAYNKQEEKDFYSNVNLINTKPLNKIQHSEIYPIAESICKASSLIKQKYDIHKIYASWLVVRKAYTLTLAEWNFLRETHKANVAIYELNEDSSLFYQPNDEPDENKYNISKNKLTSQKALYYVGSKALLFDIIQKLPLELQLLKILYVAGEYQKIENLLNQFFALPANDAETYSRFINDLANTVEYCNNDLAAKHLARDPQFVKLPLEIRSSLTEQRAYVIMLRAYLSFMNDDNNAELKLNFQTCSSALEANLNQIMKTKSSNDKIRLESEIVFSKIKQKLNILDDEVRKKRFTEKLFDPVSIIFKNAREFDYSSVKPRTAMILSTAIVGLAYTSGMALTLGTSLASAAAKAEIESQQANIPELEDETKFEQQFEPMDYAYIKQEDTFWNKHAYKDARNYAITNDSILHNFKDYLIDTATKNVTHQFEKNIQPTIDENTKSFSLKYSIILNNAIMIAKFFAGVLVITAVVLLPIFASLGLTGPLLVLVSVPAISVAIIAALSMTAAKIFVEPNSNVDIFLDKTIALIFSPIALVNSGISMLMQPFNNLFDKFTSNSSKLASPIMVRESKLMQADRLINLSTSAAERLNKLQPGFADLLLKHFKGRAAEIQNIINNYDDNTEVEKINNVKRDLDLLEYQWTTLINNLPLSEKFFLQLEEYLSARYDAERKNFIKSAEQRMTTPAATETKETTRSLVVKVKPTFSLPKMDDYEFERKKLQELHALKVIALRAKLN